MKKRIFMLALVVGVLLSFSASAWATLYYKGNSITVNNMVYDAKAGAPVSLDVTVAVDIVSSDSVVSGYGANASYVSWDASNINYTGAKIEDGNYEGTTQDQYYAIKLSTQPATSMVWTFDLTIYGNLISPDKNITINVALNTSSDNKLTVATDAGTTTSDVTVTDLSETEYKNQVGDPTDERNPYGYAWNSIDPVLENSVSISGYGKAKPKLGKFAAKTDLDFTAGTSKDLDVPLVGPITKVDVYIAAKDAIKLGYLEKGATNNIQLTRDNIKTYNIPFRITSYDFANANDLEYEEGTTEAKTKKNIEKAWKSAENTLTLQFNGGYYQLKGYPITIAMSNSNTTSKPVAKAIKLNVKPNDSTPVWTYDVTSGDNTTIDLSTAQEWAEAANNQSYEAVYLDVFVKSDDAPSSEDWALTKVTVDVVFTSTDSKSYIIPGYVFDKTTSADVKNNENKIYGVADTENVLHHYNLLYTQAYDKKDKPEASAVVDVANKSAGTISETYTVSADGPYFVTVKPDPTKDKTKLEKFFASGYSVTITDPVFDYLGNVTTPASVTITGKPKETAKESKLALTLTAQNGSTKKKGALKVTASGKLAPYFEIGKGAATINGETYITTKRVEAGKTPSVKFKAKGSKTIAYKLGAYTLEDGELVEDYSYYTADKYEEMLASVKLSFDEKKGAVVLADKNDKATPPTSDDEEFQSLDIVVTAYNNVGATQAHAQVAITGGKPAVSDKEVSFTSGDALYSCKTFELKAGKDVASATSAANIRSTVTSDVAKTLAGYGLALVNWDEMYAETDETKTVASGDPMPDGWSISDSADLVVEDDSTGAPAEVEGKIIASGGYVVYYTGNKTSDYVGVSADLKNKGIIQVIDTATLAKKTNTKGESITFTLENLGAVNTKAKIKVKITAGTASGSSSSATANAEGAKAAAKANVKSGHGYAPADETALEAEEAEKAEDTEAEAKVTFGAARTADSLSAAQQAFLADNGYTVVAVLPEATAEADGQYDFDVVDLNENAPEGKKLVWLAFPKDGSYSEDDEIADFYDEAGEPIENVPASLKVKVSAWLRAGVTYEPVIAVKD